LNDDIPRVFIAVKNNKVCSIPSNKKTTSMSILESQGSSKSEDSPEEKQQQQQQSCINAAAIEHCTDLELEPPYATTLRTKEDKMNFLQYIGRFVVLEDDNLDPLRTKPFAEKKKREDATRRTILWLGGFVAVAAVVVASVCLFWNKGTNRNRSTHSVKVGK